MHSNTRRNLHAIGVLAGLVPLLALAGAVTAQSGSQNLGEIVWPGEGQRSSQQLAELGESLFVNGTEPTVIGERPIESFQIQRINDSAIRVLIGEQDGENHSFVQRHEPASPGPHADMGIQSGDLPTLVEVRPDVRDHQRVLAISGPPGSFNLDGDTVTEKMENFAGRIGFPLIKRYANGSGTYPELYSGKRGCLERTDGSCSVTAEFSVDCSSCQLASFTGPEPGSPLEGACT